ncbi:hypothetical protein VD0002_g6576 [Verticillium dahliae]|uniref:2EXR domain-containing protein n=2 Tax=Verticillium dahliae TaxID=27337 RepID=G2X888_VERDV|nr:uncharacterized protein VDAG_06029 [Verticillium dahliae VdLs.17]KAF3342391.1 Ribonuclease H [Verticillium dahliae VDG2]KAH6697810.1 hypothetical protein EV126DRAFT_60473 [Verticillium dahliae]EGY15175.1 hypothetical protein VDAG_06029 [Verticillium dahliae VdLs.17]PNH36152.1 hypothetical protein BJF96_g728 [Verticillium dahliae]PNH45545.1 hypothetical protein VD0004_g2368 [Verticillium dahliae]
MTMFHPFSRLPAELRLHIWNLAAEPRRVMILGISCYSYEGGAMVGHELFTSRTPVPAVLHACCEARQLPSYRKAFASQFASAPESRQDYVWVDFAADTIQCSESLVWFSPEERPLIRHLRMEVYNQEDFEEEGMAMMRELTALKSLDILYGYDLKHWFGMYDWDFGVCSKNRIRLISSVTQEIWDEARCRQAGKKHLEEVVSDDRGSTD